MYPRRREFPLSAPGREEDKFSGPPRTRRYILLVAAGAGFSSFIPEAIATEAAMVEAIRGVIGESKPQRGKVKLELPPIVENGNTVSLTVSVEGNVGPTSRGIPSSTKNRSLTSQRSSLALTPARRVSRPAFGSPTPNGWWRSPG
jgi:hypothetical protein